MQATQQHFWERCQQTVSLQEKEKRRREEEVFRHMAVRGKRGLA
jgi:hypothetical protein